MALAGDEGGVDVDFGKVIDNNRQLAPLTVSKQVVEKGGLSAA